MTRLQWPRIVDRAADIVTRYDKREPIYQGTIDVASIRIWLRDSVP